MSRMRMTENFMYKMFHPTKVTKLRGLEEEEWDPLMTRQRG